MARYRDGGEEGLEPRSKRPRSPLRQVVGELEEEIVGLRKSLTEEGLDTGAHTVQYHLLNFLDDHSRYLVAAQAFKAKGLDVVRVFQAAAQLLGMPASLLTDNGAITQR